uniref:Uncharacterized protein n=1 Tax=Setaria viridis TaxID=4556 RepID=A0A4U6VTK7_SETVI|nr:hypothetical protein SEVIR_2G220600v2 [Setaria viridis]
MLVRDTFPTIVPKSSTTPIWNSSTSLSVMVWAAAELDAKNRSIVIQACVTISSVVRVPIDDLFVLRFSSKLVVPTTSLGPLGVLGHNPMDLFLVS